MGKLLTEREPNMIQIDNAAYLVKFLKANRRLAASDIIECINYTKIGSGGYAEVFSRSDADHVLKFVDTDESKYTISYLEFCKANHQVNPILPKVVDIVNVGLRGLGARKTGIVMEKLTSTGNRMRENDFINVLTHPKRKTLKKSSFTPEHLKMFHVFINKNRLRGELDLHDGNIMMRGETPVITDPVAG